MAGRWRLLKGKGMNERVCVVTGGGGILCEEIAVRLAASGTSVVVIDLDRRKAQRTAERVRRKGGNALAIEASVLVRDELERGMDAVLDRFGSVDILINGAGGNHPKATTSDENPFFNLPEEAVRFVFDLNFLGTLLPCQVFGRIMADRGEGVILNIASMNALRPLTRIPAYSAAKAAVVNFTQWLAVHMAQEYSPRIRVNAIAPGFFLTEQNRFLLQREDGTVTERGQRILDHTPMARFGDPKDLIGAVRWLLSSDAGFVTGIVLPIDGGFSAYSGV